MGSDDFRLCFHPFSSLFFGPAQNPFIGGFGRADAPLGLTNPGVAVGVSMTSEKGLEG